VPQSIRLLAFALAFLPATLAGYAAAQGQRVSDADRLNRVAGAEAKARSEARLACAANTDALHKQIVAGTVDAAAEAAAAADRGCFGMITTVNGIPGGVSYAPGVECRPNGRLFTHGRLQLLSFAPGTDSPSPDRAEMERFYRDVASMHAFALSYNAAIIAHPDFPYGDLCRAAAPDYRPSWPVEQLEPTEWGFRPLEETDHPRDLYEAARHGTLESLHKWIDYRAIDMHVPDVLGLTPLAWAVIYDRPAAHIQLLLNTGADPYGEPYWNRPQPNSPITLAETEGRRHLLPFLQKFLKRPAAVETE
jgi:hypothetical protein